MRACGEVHGSVQLALFSSGHSPRLPRQQRGKALSATALGGRLKGTAMRNREEPLKGTLGPSSFFPFLALGTVGRQIKEDSVVTVISCLDLSVLFPSAFYL